MKWFTAVVAIVIVLFLLKLGELYTQLARYQAYWHRQNQETLANSRVENTRYYVLGDSTAQGIGATSPKNSYPSIVAEHLAAKYSKEVEVINLSKSGATVSDVAIKQVPVMDSLGIKDGSIVTVAAGANDILTFDKTKFEHDMDDLMGKLPKQTIIADVPSFSGSRNSSMERKVLEANEILVRLSDKHGLKRAVIYDKTSANRALANFSIDFFHPSDKGYRENWAPAFIEQL